MSAPVIGLYYLGDANSSELVDDGRPVGPGTNYPFALPSIDALIEWRFRVRFWEASINLNFAMSPTPDIPVVGGSTSTNVGSEAELLPYGTALVTGGVDGTEPYATSPDYIEYSVTMQLAAPGFTKSILREGLIYPYFRAFGRVDWFSFLDDEDGGSYDQIAVAGLDSQNQYEDSTSITCSVAGYPVTIYTGLALATGASGTMEFNPVEWWPYDDGLGLGNTWDTSTGGLLQPGNITAARYIAR